MADDKLFEDPDELVVSKVQRAVQIAMQARKEAEDANKEAIDAATTFGYELGVIDREQEILAWIEENRSAIEIEPGENIYRDHFNSQSLIDFIKGKKSSTDE
jgi:hypothetical protein